MQGKKGIFLLVSCSIILFWLIDTAWAQSRKKIDLDDLMIKGELHNDDRLMILSRQKNDLKNFVKFRTNFKEEILQEQLVTNSKKRR